MTGVAVVLWDADGVLQQVGAGREESMRPAVAGLVEDPDAFVAEALAAERPALEGRARWLDVLPGLLERWGIGHELDRLVDLWLSIEPVAAARDLVGPLRAAGVGCYLATNQDAHRARHMRRHLGYDELLDGTFASCELGVAKPDPAYFTEIVRRLGIPAGQALLVDDNAANVAAARSVGLAAEVWSSAEDVQVLRRHLRAHGLPA